MSSSFAALQVGNMVRLEAAAALRSSSGATNTWLEAAADSVALAPSHSPAGLFEVLKGNMPGTVKLRNVKESKLLGTTAQKAVLWLTTMDQWSDFIVLVEERGVFLTFASNAISLSFTPEGYIQPPDKIGSGKPTAFKVIPCTLAEASTATATASTTASATASATASTTAYTSTSSSTTTSSMTGSSSLVPAKASAAVSNESVLPPPLLGLKPATKESIITLYQACLGIKRPVTLIIKNDLPDTLVTLFSVTHTNGKISKYSADPLNASAGPGQAIFWQCVQKRLVGAAGEAHFNITHLQYQRLHTTFSIQWNHPVGHKHSAYSEGIHSPPSAKSDMVTFKLTRAGTTSGHAQIVAWVVSMT
ncbi:hypothetical protein Pelo_13611 [Pelomyxa schiedti]|nr:hypothetical protein Pelo_13611 [Pelomyxa schiedti]